ncbi:MAG TPA: hypothetical protein VND90_06745 [Terracidiphilus sp.]|nr:hypothetical protein [Terracidiphilus sp.]
MSEELQPQAAPAPANPAVDHCLHVFNSVFRTELARGVPDYIAAKKAGIAFRSALPPLDGHHNIRNFIACVAHGILLGAIEDRQSSKLLYAAQVALAAARPRVATQPSSAT